MSNLRTAFKEFLRHRFNLADDKANDADIVSSISRNIEFRGTNLWTLIFAIFIASIGLNVNSTAVVIGAMLISPLMSPLIGIGMGIAINDFNLVRRSAKNLLIAVLFSILTSTIYFFITPLHQAQSELLSRTTPTIWDVFIALFGGLAGIVGVTRREKTNVIPGVAIATALMPPLCTAGFGLAIGNYLYFFGALYLFFINSVFICLGTFLIVRLLKIHKKESDDPVTEKRITRYIWLIVTLTVLPSIYLAYRIVDRSIFETNANQFLAKEFDFTNTQIVGKTLNYSSDKSEINLLLIGKELTAPEIKALKNKLPEYHLDTSIKLTIRQGLNAKQEIDFSQVKASILEEVYQKQALEDSVSRTVQYNIPLPELAGELKALYPTIVNYSLSNLVVRNLDSIGKNDTSCLFLADIKGNMNNSEVARLKKWLINRIKRDSVQIILR